MSDDLKNLLDAITTLSAIEEGNIDLGMFNKITRVGSSDANRALIVPWQLTDYGLSREQAGEVWEAIWSDPASLAAWAEYMEALRVYYNIPLPPEPVPEPIITEFDRPPPQSKSTRRSFKSLAKRLKLRR